jgi:large subunit ribosomal protein L4
VAQIDIINLENKKVGELDLADKVFNAEVKPHLLHSAVRVNKLAARGGNASTKSRSDVAGGGSKPWRQKGTGNARAGTSSSPIWVGGGAAFGPKPRKYNLSLNKKVRKAALVSALSMKYQDKDLIVLEDIDLKEAKTKTFSSVLESLGVQKPLIVYSGENINLDLSSRNIVGVKALKSEGLNVFDILKHKTLVVTRDAIDKIQEVLS